MKIRTDFVSNSSTSSFVLYGAAFDNDELINAFKYVVNADLKLNAKYNTGNDEDLANYNEYDMAYAIVEFCDSKYGNDVVKYERGISDYYDMHCFGVSFDEMKDNETKAQFLDRIRLMLSEIFGSDVKVGQCIDAGSDC